MDGWICKKVSILSSVSLVAAVVALAASSSPARAEVSFQKIEATHYTETSWLPQYDDMVITSRLRADLFQAGPLRAYAGALLEQDTRSNTEVIYNDNGVSPLIGASIPLILPQLAVFTEYRQTFRMFNKPDSRASSQPDFLVGSYGYNYWSLAALAKKTSLFEEAYGDLVARSKLSFDPTLESWSKTGARWSVGGGFSLDTFLDLEFRRAATGEREDNFQTLGPGLRLNYGTRSYSIALSAHEEFGSYSNSAESISRWKGLFVLSGAF